MTRAKVFTILLGVLLSAGLGLMLLSRGYFGPPVITVVNDSGSKMSSPVLKGDGFLVALPDVVPGGSVTTIVHPSGESGLQIDFQLEGRLLTTDNLTYIESRGGYVTTVTVQRGGQIECQTRLGFSWKRAI